MVVPEVVAVHLRSGRLELEPLRADHAQEMHATLDDPGLHTYTGDGPLSLDELTARYAIQVAGQSPDGRQYWLNWIVRRCDTGQAIGYVQSTISKPIGESAAEIAWVIGTAHQRHGYATEAARTAVQWLHGLGIATVVAHIHPTHTASMAVARAVGLRPTGTVIDGETRWLG